MHNRQQLIDRVREQALEFGEFTLASGEKTNFYLDCRKVTLCAPTVSLIAEAMIAELAHDWPDAVGGMAVGSVPITGAILAKAGQMQRPLAGFFVRKQAKAHGQARQVEGPVHPGQRVVIVEDVVTTGGSSIQAIEQCRAFGLEVNRVLAIVDRLAGGAKQFAELGCQFTSLMTIEDLGLRLET